MRPDLTPDEARARLATARQEAAEASALIEGLAERVRNGEDVTAEQLGGQKQLADLAQLRVEAAERKLAEAIEADRHARCTEAVQTARDLLDADDTAPVVDAVNAIRTAVTGLVDAVNARNADVATAGSTLALLNDELSREAGTFGERGSWPLFDRYRARGDRTHIIVRDPERGQLSATELNTIDLTVAAVLVALSADPNTMHLHDRIRLGNGTIANLGKAVPGLAEGWRVTAEEWAALNQRGRHNASEQGRMPLPADTD